MLLLHMLVLPRAALAAAAVRVPRVEGQLAGVPGGPPGPAAEMLHAVTSNIWTWHESKLPNGHCAGGIAAAKGATRYGRLRRWRCAGAACAEVPGARRAAVPRNRKREEQRTVWRAPLTCTRRPAHHPTGKRRNNAEATSDAGGHAQDGVASEHDPNGASTAGCALPATEHSRSAHR